MSQVKATPQSSYTGPIVVDPLTRIEGHLRIEVEVEGGKIKNARSCGTLFRGLELILKGRDPRDAQHFTQRTCGVCTYTHALASTRCLEDAINKPIPANATYIRNLVLAMQFMHDHIVHFYHLHALDFVDVANALQADPAKAGQAGRIRFAPQGQGRRLGRSAGQTEDFCGKRPARPLYQRLLPGRPPRLLPGA